MLPFLKFHLWVSLFVLLLIASLLSSSGREVNYLNARLVFHLNGKTIISGQPPGCRIIEVPTVILSREYKDACLRDAATSPDAFIFAAAMKLKPKSLPPLAMWRGHPGLDWAAIHVSNVLPYDSTAGKGARVRFDVQRGSQGRVEKKSRVTVGGTTLHTLTREDETAG